MLLVKIRQSICRQEQEMLRRADVEDMEVKLVRTRLRWLGHVC